MFKFKLPTLIALPALILGSMILTGCLDQGNTGPINDEKMVVLERPIPFATGEVEVAILIAGVEESPGIPLLPLKKIIVNLVSTTGDSLSDTLTSTTTPSLNPLTEAAQSYSMHFSLTAQVWKGSAKALDTCGAVVRSASTEAFIVNAGTTGRVSLNLCN